MSREPRVLEWMERASLMSRFHYCPVDDDERVFLLEMISKEDD